MREVIRERLSKEADSAGVALDTVMSVVFFEGSHGHRTVHVHSFRPGIAIGRRGTVALELREGLRALTGDSDLSLNVHGHQADHGCGERRRASAGPEASDT